MQLVFPSFSVSSFKARTASRCAAQVHHRMHRHAILAVPTPLGREIVCLDGSLWLTYDGDPRDIMLGAGQHHVADCAARLLVQALEPSRLAFGEPSRPSAD